MSLSNGEENGRHEETLFFWRRYHLLSWPFLCPLQSLLSAQKSSRVKARWRQGACTAVLFVACRLLRLLQRWYTCFSCYVLPIRSEVQSDGLDEDGWCDESRGCVLLWEPRGAGCHDSFPAKGNERPPAVSSALLPRPRKARIWSVVTQTYQLGVHTSKVYKAATMLTGNRLVEFISASVRFKNTFLDSRVNYMNTPTFFSVPEHRRGMMIFFE